MDHRIVLVRATPRRVIIALLAMAALALRAPAGAQLHVFEAATNVPAIVGPPGEGGPAGLEYMPLQGALLASVNFSTNLSLAGLPYNFEIVHPDATHGQYSAVSGIRDEVDIDSIREPSGGFTVGDVFFGDNTGMIFRFPLGAPAPVPFAQLAPWTDHRPARFYKDDTGVWGGDLLANSSDGRVWRVTSAGVVTLVAQNPPGVVGDNSGQVWLEMGTTVPNNPALYGLWAGKYAIAGEAEKGVYTVDPAGNWAFYPVPPTTEGPEDVKIVPPCENLFSAGYQFHAIWGVPSADLQPFVGDIFVQQEVQAGVLDTKFSGGSPVFTNLALIPSGGAPAPVQWEELTFAPIGVGPVPPVSGTPTVSMANTLLWPPNHDLCDAGLSITATCGGNGAGLPPGTVVSVKVYSNEPDQPSGSCSGPIGDDHFSPDAKFDGTTLRLRCERLGDPNNPDSGPGRVYLVAVTITPSSGPASTSYFTAVVPHDMSATSISTINGLAAQALAQAQANGNPATWTVAVFQVGIGPICGPKQ